MYERVVRFTDVRAERVDQLVARIKEASGPPPGVRTSGIKLLFDEAQGTAMLRRSSRRHKTWRRARRCSPRWIPLRRRVRVLQLMNARSSSFSKFESGASDRPP